MVGGIGGTLDEAEHDESSFMELITLIVRSRGSFSKKFLQW